MLKLYGGARSRASIVQWYLEELTVPYEFVFVDLQTGEHQQLDYLAINPIGKVPAIVDGDYPLWESGAILLYLAEKYGDRTASLDHRYQLAQWVFFANATLGPGVFVETSRPREMPRLLSALEQQLSQSPYLVGEQFSVADVAVGSTLAYMTLMLKIYFDEYPSIDRYLKQIYDRSAFQKTIGGRSSTSV